MEQIAIQHTQKKKKTTLINGVVLKRKLSYDIKTPPCSYSHLRVEIERDANCYRTLKMVG